MKNITMNPLNAHLSFKLYMIHFPVLFQMEGNTGFRSLFLFQAFVYGNLFKQCLSFANFCTVINPTNGVEHKITC